MGYTSNTFFAWQVSSGDYQAKKVIIIFPNYVGVDIQSNWTGSNLRVTLNTDPYG